MSDFPQIFTFYSFKGGVGRSMAVLNVAYALVAKGRNVLVLDMDLEAPGLSGFLRRHKEIGDFAGQDVVDLGLKKGTFCFFGKVECPLFCHWWVIHSGQTTRLSGDVRAY